MHYCLLVFSLGLVVLTDAQTFSCPEDTNRNPINGTFVHPNNCQAYYICIDGVATLQQCPPGTHFSPVFQPIQCAYAVCVDISESRCVTYSFEEDEYEYEQSEPENPSNDLECPDQGELTRPNPDDCTQYYHCRNGQSWPQECPSGTVFNPQVSTITCTYELCVAEELGECAIDGGWGEWGNWSECTSDCGLGFRNRERECNNPPPSNGGRDCQGNSVDREICVERNCTADFATAFYAIRNSPWSTFPPWECSASDGKIEYTSIPVNLGNAYNLTNDVFRPKEDGGVYFISMSSGIQPDQGGAKNFRNTQGFPTILGMGCDRTSTGHEGTDVISRDGIYSLTPEDQVEMQGDCLYDLYSGDGSEISWTLFNYNDMGSLINSAFFAGFVSSSIDLPENPLRFDIEVTNIGDDYDTSTGIYTAPAPGLYFFSVSFGTSANIDGDDVQVMLNCEGACVEYRPANITRTSSRTNTGIDILSRGVIYRLGIGDQVSVRSATGFYSNNDLVTSFAGFAYYPGTSQAWYVARRSDFYNFDADLDPMEFEEVVVNQGIGWGATGGINMYTCQVTGYYYVKLNVGAQQGRRVDARVIKEDGNEIMNIYRGSNSHDGEDSLSKSMIVRLVEGERLRVVAKAGTGIYSDQGHQTSFMGMLLYPDP